MKYPLLVNSKKLTRRGDFLTSQKFIKNNIESKKTIKISHTLKKNTYNKIRGLSKNGQNAQK